MYTLIEVWGHWNDDLEPFTRTVAVAHQPLTDAEIEAALDENVFYVFNFGEPVIGKHKGFTITEQEVY